VPITVIQGCPPIVTSGTSFFAKGRKKGGLATVASIATFGGPHYWSAQTFEAPYVGGKEITG
jgi:hypothetical protein